jgi:short-subunit dehydrogenase
MSPNATSSPIPWPSVASPCGNTELLLIPQEEDRAIRPKMLGNSELSRSSVMRRELKGLRILVTGASEGIGREIVREAVQRGAKVLAVARRTQLLEQLAKEIPGISIVTADVSSPEGRQAMLHAAQNQLGGLDVLINNAGFGASGQFVDLELQTLRDIFETNYFGLIELVRLFVPELSKGTTPAIVNISSILGKRAWPARSFYSASKFAVQGFSNALREELKPKGIDLLVVCPGLTNTSFPKNMRENKAKIPMNHKRGMPPEQVAQATLDALSKGTEEIHLTFLGRLLLRVNRYFPGLVDRIATRRIRRLHADEIADRERYRDAAQQAGK